jgi:hypothetical protein
VRSRCSTDHHVAAPASEERMSDTGSEIRQCRMHRENPHVEWVIPIRSASPCRRRLYRPVWDTVLNRFQPGRSGMKTRGNSAILCYSPRPRRRRLFQPVSRGGAKSFLGLEIGDGDLLKCCQPVPLCAISRSRPTACQRSSVCNAFSGNEANLP